MQIPDSLDLQKNSYNLSSPVIPNNSKYTMQTLYKKQLDQFAQQKQKQRLQQKNRQQAQKKQYNQKVLYGKQSQKMKQLAYKNYYNMLLINQEQVQHAHIIPLSVRDEIKDNFVKKSLEEGQLRMKKMQVQQKKREEDKKNTYRSQLLNQIEQRKKIQILNKQRDQIIKQELKKYNKLPEQITKYEREKQMQEMNKYKSDLDTIRNERDYFSRVRALSNRQPNVNLSSHQHNALINPLPYNIQNPYILKQISRQGLSLGHNNSKQQKSLSLDKLKRQPLKKLA